MQSLLGRAMRTVCKFEKLACLHIQARREDFPRHPLSAVLRAALDQPEAQHWIFIIRRKPVSLGAAHAIRRTAVASSARNDPILVLWLQLQRTAFVEGRFGRGPFPDITNQI